VGGGTVHMSGFFFRMREDDFRLRSRFGEVPGARVADWPFALADLEPHYDEVERVIGVSGDHVAEGRKTAYPLGPLVTHPSGAIVDAACAKLRVKVFQCARAIVSAPYDGRMACHHCGFCGSYGCEAGAKSSSLVTFLARAQATGRLTLNARAQAVKVTRSGDTCDGVEWRDEKGQLQRTRAKIVVLAASAIETARLLLVSELGNESGLVGKNLMFSSMASGTGRFPLPDPRFPSGPPFLPFIDRVVQEHYVAPKEAALPHPKAGTILFMLPHKNPIYRAERAAKTTTGVPLYGAALKAALRRTFLETGAIEWEAFGESLPHDGTAVTLDPLRKDRFGVPVARIATSLHPASLAASDWLATKGHAILEAAGAIESTSGDERTYTVLQCGTARMGRDPASSVTDPDGRVHSMKNLWIADASTFPSSSGAPFTLTIMANAMRVAERLVARAKAAH
jgi:choline dehydrogenase-like flavoprotein